MNKLHLTMLRFAALTVAGLLLGSAAARAQTPPSPVGTWDLVYSGSQKGLAAITFNADNTLTGFEVVRPVPRKSSSTDVDPRHPSVDNPGRTVVTTTTTSGGSKVVTNLLGSAPLTGVWYHDDAGKTIGLLGEIVETVTPVEKYSTNVINDVVIISTNVVLEVTSQTNGISFRAVVVPNSRITLYTYSPNGNNTLRGKPATLMPDLLTGDFYSIGKRDTLNFVEFMSFLQNPLFANRYDVDGIGPGYSFTGRVLVSNQKQIAIANLSLDGSAVLSVYTGSFNLTSHKGKLSGVDSSDRKVSYNLSPLP